MKTTQKANTVSYFPVDQVCKQEEGVMVQIYTAACLQHLIWGSKWVEIRLWAKSGRAMKTGRKNKLISERGAHTVKAKSVTAK